MAKVNITQVKSRIGATKIQCKNLDALGLRRMGRTVQHEDSATIMGMIERVRHLVRVEMNAAPKAETVAPAAAKAEVKPAAVKKVPAVAKAAKPAGEKKAAARKPAAKKTNE